jgi:hypothetical protein
MSSPSSSEGDDAEKTTEVKSVVGQGAEEEGPRLGGPEQQSSNEENDSQPLPPSASCSSAKTCGQ